MKMGLQKWSCNWHNDSQNESILCVIKMFFPEGWFWFEFLKNLLFPPLLWNRKWNCGHLPLVLFNGTPFPVFRFILIMAKSPLLKATHTHKHTHFLKDGCVTSVYWDFPIANHIQTLFTRSRWPCVCVCHVSWYMCVHVCLWRSPNWLITPTLIAA